MIGDPQPLSNRPKLEAVHPEPDKAWMMPYAPAVRIVGACDLMFLSGATASTLYHHHPHIDSEHIHPHGDRRADEKNAMDAIKSILDEVGAGWADVIKITKYLTDIRDADGMHATMRTYFGDWIPASTMICINQLSSPGRPHRARHDRRRSEPRQPCETSAMNAAAAASRQRLCRHGRCRTPRLSRRIRSASSMGRSPQWGRCPNVAGG